MTEPVTPDAVLELSPLTCVPAVFYRPTRAFASLARRPSWWIPCLIAILAFQLTYFSFVPRFDLNRALATQSAEHPTSPQVQQLERLTPQQRELGLKVAQQLLRDSWFGLPALMLLYFSVEAAVLLLIARLAFHSSVDFSRIFSVVWYAHLPRVLLDLLVLPTIFLNHNPSEHFLAGYRFANLASYLNPAHTPSILYALARSLDPFSLWTLFLTVVGLSLVAEIPRSRALVAALCWWFGQWILFLVGVVTILLTVIFVYGLVHR